MKTYSVRLPITGIADVEVEAEIEEAAIEAALDMPLTYEAITEWNTVRQIIQGNVFYGELNEAEATEQ